MDDDPKQPQYTPDEIAFIQKLMDRYSEGGGIIDLAEDHRAFMGVVRAYRIAAEAAARKQALEDAITAVRGECLEDPQDESDAGYMAALGDAETAIRALKENQP